MKSAFAAIVGRPSSGKSTLLNALCGHKVSIVSPIPQTTRNQVRGIVNRPGVGQVVFLDTPGFHLSDKKFNLAMMDSVTHALKDADVICYLVDAARAPGAEETALLEILKKMPYKPMIAILNKTDYAVNFVSEFEALIKEHLSVKAIVPISALKEKNLDQLLTEIFLQTEEGPAYYPDDYYTDQDPSFRVAEIIREQTINRLNEEIPHAVYVEVADLEYRDAETKPTLWIRAFITVDRDSQIGIVVGTGGQKIKEIRQASQKELGKIFTQHIHLDLRVKVNAKWRTKDHLIKNILGSSQGPETLT